MTVEEVLSWYWDNAEKAEKDLDRASIVWGVYDSGAYDGSCWLLYEKDGNLYEVESSHCSCNGLDWYPDETSWDVIFSHLEKIQKNEKYTYGPLKDNFSEAYKAITGYVGQL